MYCIFYFITVFLTALQEGYGLVFNLRSELPAALQVLKDVDIGGKTQHVLLSTAIRHSQQITDVLQSTTHKITCGQKSNITISMIKNWKLLNESNSVDYRVFQIFILLLWRNSASIFLGSPRTVTKLLAESLTKTVGRVRETDVSCGWSNRTEKKKKNQVKIIMYFTMENHFLYLGILHRV